MDGSILKMFEGPTGALRAWLDGSPRWQLARLLPRTDPRLAASVAALTLVEGLTPNARSVAGGALIGAVSAALASGDADTARGTVALTLAALGVAFLLPFALTAWRAALSDGLARRFMREMMERQMRAMLRPATVAHLEDPALLDQMERARNTGGSGRAWPPTRCWVKSRRACAG